MSGICGAGYARKKRGTRSRKILSENGMISCRKIKRCRKTQKLQSSQDKKEQVGWRKRAGDSKKGMPNLKNWVKQIQKTSVTEVELDEEIRNMQAGDERRGSCAQSNGCCFDPVMVLEPDITM